MAVTVRLAGPCRVEQGSPPEELRIGSAKERRLLAVLAAHRPHSLPPDRLAEALWPGRLPRSPAANIATLVSRLRARLGAGAVLGDRQGYRLGEPPTVRVDLDEAADLVAQASRRLVDGAPGTASMAARRALDLTEAEPLSEEDDAPWVVDVRRRWHELRRTAHHHAAGAALATGDATTARTFSSDALAADPYDEPAVRLLLAADQMAGEPARAIVTYHEFRARLADELGVQPSPPTREAYLALLQETPPSPVSPAASQVGHPPSRAAPAMVGRAAETARLTAHWERAGTGDAAVVLVVGEAGIGKTRLTAELHHSAAGDRRAGGRRSMSRRRALAVPPTRGRRPRRDPRRARRPTNCVPRPAPARGSWVGSSPTSPRRSASPDLDASSPDARRTFESIGALLRRPHRLRGRCCWSSTTCTTRAWRRRSCCTTSRCAPGGARLLVLATVRARGGRHGPRDPRRRRRADRPRAARRRGGRRARRPRRARRSARRHPPAGPGATPSSSSRPCTAWAPGSATSPRRCRPPCRPGPAARRGRGGAPPGRRGPGRHRGPRILVARLLGLDPGRGRAAVRTGRRRRGSWWCRAPPTSSRTTSIHEILYVTTPDARPGGCTTGVRPTCWPRPPRPSVPTPSRSRTGPARRGPTCWPGSTPTARGGVGDAESLQRPALGAAHRRRRPELRGRVLLARARAREGLERYDAPGPTCGAADAAPGEAGDRRLRDGRPARARWRRRRSPAAARRREHRAVCAGSAPRPRCGDRAPKPNFRARLAVLARTVSSSGRLSSRAVAPVAAGRAAGGDRPCARSRRSKTPLRLPRPRSSSWPT